MRLFVIALALCASLMNVTSQASAAAFGSSIMNTSNLRLQYFNGSSWVNATNAQGAVFGSAVTSQSSATLGTLNQASGLLPGLNATQSFVSPTITAPLEQSVLPLTGLGPSTLNSFARGDTFGSGNTIIGGSLSTSTLAELNSLGTVTGLATGNLSNVSIFTVNIAQFGEYRLAFDANLAMQTTGDGFATNSFGVSVSQSQTTGNTVSKDDNDASLNRSINGSSTVNVSSSFFSTAVSLEAGQLATFKITQNTTAGANNVVPEPSSMAIFGLMSAGSFLAWRRRRV